MKNILTTIPKSKYRTLEEFESAVTRCDGSSKFRFWLVNTNHLPAESPVDAQCYLVFDGFIRGYFTIMETDVTENWRGWHGIGKARTTKSMIMCTWRPITPIPYKGFMGWRYTQLK